MEIPEDFERIPTRSFGHESRDLTPIPDEHDLLLVALYGVDHGAEVTGDLGNRKRLHERTVSDRI